VLEYLREVDGEHQSLHQHFLTAHIAEHGFDDAGLSYLLACAGNIQHLQHLKTYPALIANQRSLNALLALRGASESDDPSGISAFAANLRGEPVEDYAWRHALYAIWGDAAEERDPDGRVGAKLIKGAPAELRPLYEAILA
jgi:hypothetical protein